jgi:hypothetical protein
MGSVANAETRMKDMPMTTAEQPTAHRSKGVSVVVGLSALVAGGSRGAGTSSTKGSVSVKRRTSPGVEADTSSWSNGLCSAPPLEKRGKSLVCYAANNADCWPSFVVVVISPGELEEERSDAQKQRI